MKKLLFLTFLLLLITALGVSAQTFPHPIYGHLTAESYAVQGADLTIHNLVTDKSAIATTNNGGFFQADLGNFDTSYREGDTIKVTINYCTNLEICSKTVVVSGGGNEVSWDIKDLEQAIIDSGGDPILPGTIQIVNYQCWDGSLAGDISQCPPKPVMIECDDGTFVNEGATCPEKSSNGWIWGIIVFLAGLFGLGGWKFYNGKFKHYHYGINSYHDPNTQHTNVKYRHVAFNKHPFKCIKEVNKIQKGIDLEEEDDE